MSEYSESDMWNREDEYGQPEDVNEDIYEDIYEEEDEEEVEDILEELFEDESFPSNEQSLMDSARIRLEQGRLYEMLIKHNLFEGVESAPEAINAVQDEIKGFIMERLEILLGMRSEKETEIHVVKEASFNDMEVKALKMIAAKVTKGASKVESEEEEEYEEPSQINTVKKVVPQKGLNTLGAKKVKTAPKPLVQKQVAKPVQKKQAKPLRKKPKAGAVKKRKKLKKEMKEVGTGGRTINEVAKKDIKYLDSLKNMTLEQKAEIVEERHNRPRSPVGIDQDAVNSIYNTQMSMNTEANSLTAMLRAAKKV